MTYPNETSGPSTSSALKNIKDDARTLQSDVIDLAKQAKDEGRKRLDDGLDMAREKASALKQTGSNEIEMLKSYVVSNPGQSVLGAFALGALVTMILAARR